MRGRTKILSYDNQIFYENSNLYLFGIRKMSKKKKKPQKIIVPKLFAFFLFL